MYRVSQKYCAPFVWLLWRSCIFNYLGFTQSHGSSFNIEFEILFESILQAFADLWQRKDKISGCFKNSTSVVLQQCQNKANFQRKGSSIVLKFLLNVLKV